MSSENNTYATRVIASTVGILCGISGLQHGFFETFQGNVKPEHLLISAIGSAQRFWPGGTETALTIVHSFFITGILAMTASLMVIIWSARFIHTKYGAVVFLLLSVFQFLVGGGFAQIFLVLLTTAAATQINASLKWWRYCPAALRRILAKLWFWLLVIFSISLLGSMIAAIFGYFPIVSELFNLNQENMTGFLYSLGYSMLVLLPFTILAGFSYDAENKPLYLQQV
jgi:hypothetical protein